MRVLFEMSFKIVFPTWEFNLLKPRNTGSTDTVSPFLAKFNHHLVAYSISLFTVRSSSLSLLI